jgi:hypothetical protein
MPAEGFFHRWSRLKVAPDAALPDVAAPRAQPSPPAAPGPQAAPGPAVADTPGDSAAPPLPTLADVAQLGADSDYAPFVARGVDQSVRRGALKKLFSDPHFNIGDGLDLYMGDYNRPDPIPAAMMSALRHTESFFAQAYPENNSEEEGGAGRASPARAAPVSPAQLADGKEADCGDNEDAPPACPDPQMADTTGAAGANEANA